MLISGTGYISKYAKMRRGRDVIEVMNLIHLALVKKGVPKYVYNLKTVNGLGRGISDHSVVLC